MKWLITGSGGILGSTFHEVLAAQQIPCVAVRHRELDIANRSAARALLEQHRPDVVVNAAGMTAVDACETQRDAAMTVNADAPGFLAETCRQLQIRFVHISTDYVFNGEQRTPYAETDTPHPLSVYAESKARGEALVLKSCPEALVIRVAWAFRNGGKTFLCRLRDLIFQESSLQVANDRLGNCTYSFDFVEAARALIEAKAAGLVHFTNEGELSWFDFAVALRDQAVAMGLSPKCSEIHPVSSAQFKLPARRPVYSVLDKSRYRQLTGKQIRHWKDTLPDFLGREKI